MPEQDKAIAERFGPHSAAYHEAREDLEKMLALNRQFFMITTHRMIYGQFTRQILGIDLRLRSQIIPSIEKYWHSKHCKRRHKKMSSVCRRPSVRSLFIFTASSYPPTAQNRKIKALIVRTPDLY
jgi:hypothetical protein